MTMVTDKAFFDLIYVSGPDGRTMSCAIRDSSGDKLIGPFPAKEAGPKIVAALVEHAELGFANAKEGVSVSGPQSPDPPLHSQLKHSPHCDQRCARGRRDILEARMAELLQLCREPLCRMCRPRLTPATVADHEAPHRGDAVLFWDPDNLQSLCKRCHDGDKQRIEKGSKPKPRISLSGWPEE
jgi:5-methylcytosine-specific restriction protein A